MRTATTILIVLLVSANLFSFNRVDSLWLIANSDSHSDSLRLLALDELYNNYDAQGKVEGTISVLDEIYQLKAEAHYHQLMADEKEIIYNRFQYLLIIIIALSAIFITMLAAGFFKKLKDVRKAKNMLEVEKIRSDKLLLNILPIEVAEELKQYGASKARKYKNVSVLFCDIKEFTQAAERNSPEELISEINICFKAFDKICEKFQIEKIKTIGDAYMAAGGVPKPSKHSTINIIHAAMEMRDFMISRKLDRDAEGKLGFDMRIGIHTGDVVAGIVGTKKFQYDIWGDTVNLAARLESAGEVGKINVSKATITALGGTKLYDYTYRGKVHAKGKGEIDMFFLFRKKEDTFKKISLFKQTFPKLYKTPA